MVIYIKEEPTMQISVSSTLTVYHDGQFWVGLAEDGRYGAARIVFGAEPSNEEILRFVVNKWAKLSFFGHDPTEASKPAKNPKRRGREAAKALKQPAMSTKAQQALAAQREAMKRESAQARSQRRADEAKTRFEQRKLKRKQKHRGH
jgi:hypothetical protein